FWTAPAQPSRRRDHRHALMERAGAPFRATDVQWRRAGPCRFAPLLVSGKALETNAFSHVRLREARYVLSRQGSSLGCSARCVPLDTALVQVKECAMSPI